MHPSLPNWPKREYKSDMFGNSGHNAFEGGAIGAFKNDLHYDIKIGGSKSNVVNVIDKTVLNPRGAPEWAARVDMPHGNVNFPHINVNEAITGVKDPHIPISATSAQIAGGAGQVLKVINKAGPALMAASIAIEGYKINEAVKQDVENHTTSNTIKQVANTVASTGGGIGGCVAGASIGASIHPVFGPMAGCLVGATAGATAGGAASDAVSDVILEKVNDDSK